MECGNWGSIEEIVVNKEKESSDKNYQPINTQTVNIGENSLPKRTLTNIGELDRVLGGGLVPGSFILLGGEPGIGKSTLALQLASLIPNTLYISGEESVHQISLRANRIKAKQNNLELANATELESIIKTIKNKIPTLVILDSIQTIYSNEVPGEPGNVNQIRACATKLLEFSKQNNISIFLIGHVTKDGSVAGPKTLEHLVDTVLYLEGEQHHNMRILRAVKNRFGSTDEVGIFDMDEDGLKEISNPSELLLSERGDNMPGSVVTCLLEGSRPMLVEVQALVTKTTFGYPVRKASGFDLNRLHVLIAVLQRRAGLNLAQSDVHLNIVGGLKTNEPAADLAICLAVASAFKDKALGKDLVAFGEVGLGGEIRTVRQTEKRLKECKLLGMKRTITALKAKEKSKIQNLHITGIKNIQELISQT